MNFFRLFQQLVFVQSDLIMRKCYVNLCSYLKSLLLLDQRVFNYFRLSRFEFLIDDLLWLLYQGAFLTLFMRQSDIYVGLCFILDGLEGSFDLLLNYQRTIVWNHFRLMHHLLLLMDTLSKWSSHLFFFCYCHQGLRERGTKCHLLLLVNKRNCLLGTEVNMWHHHCCTWQLNIC
jgi:hypothetical protein